MLCMDVDLFKVLRVVGQVPSMAMCTRCKLKFFVPNDFLRDADGAKEFLVDRFLAHKCKIPSPLEMPSRDTLRRESRAASSQKE